MLIWSGRLYGYRKSSSKGNESTSSETHASRLGGASGSVYTHCIPPPTSSCRNSSAKTSALGSFSVTAWTTECSNDSAAGESSTCNPSATNERKTPGRRDGATIREQRPQAGLHVQQRQLSATRPYTKAWAIPARANPCQTRAQARPDIRSLNVRLRVIVGPELARPRCARSETHLKERRTQLCEK